MAKREYTEEQKAAVKAPLPKEHGSWVMFFIALLAGVLVGGRLHPALPFYLVSALSLFLIRRPLEILVRPQAAQPAERLAAAIWWKRFAATGALGGAALLAFGLWQMIPLGLATMALLGVNLYRARQIARQTLASELAGAVGLALVAAGAYYATRGRLDAAALGTFLASGLYFVSGVFHVNMRIRWLKRPPLTAADRWATGWDGIVYHLVMMAAALALSRGGALPPYGWVALVPIAWRGLQAAALGRRETDFKRLGWIETTYALIFLALLVLSYRVA